MSATRILYSPSSIPNPQEGRRAWLLVYLGRRVPMANQVENYLNRTNACAEARAWVKDKQITTFKDGWRLCPSPDWLLTAVCQGGYEEYASRRVRTWVYHCLMLVQNYLQDPRCIRAVKVLENYTKCCGSQGDMAEALASAQAAVSARAKADTFAQRVSPQFHATRAVVAALSWQDNQWANVAGEGPLWSATATAQGPTTIDHPTLLEQRRQQADLFRTVFAPEVAGLINNLEQLD
jgi:hypothetical protein